MRKSVKVLFVLLFISSLIIPVGKSEEQYNHVLSIEPPEPDTALWFGNKVDIINNKILTSEPYAEVDGYIIAGRVRIFDIEGNLLTTIQSPNPDNRLYFGQAHSYKGDQLVISELNHVEDFQWVGRAFVYTLDGELVFEIPHRGEPKEALNFGFEVDVSEEQIYIYEKGVDISPSAAGLIHVYDREGTFLYTIFPPDPKPLHHFGLNIETFNDLVYVSEYGDTYGPIKAAGKVYVFDEEGTLVRTLESPDPEDRAIFGLSMSISEDYIVIGEPWATVDGLRSAGKAHVFNHDGVHLLTLKAPVAELGALFGWNVKVSGETIVVGETNADVGGEGDEGRVHVFDVNGEILQTINAPEPTKRGYFGWYIDIEGDLLAISEQWAEVDGMSNCGKIYLYKLGEPVETGESVEEGTTVVSETDTPEPSGGIPGYPLWSIGVALLLVSIIISRTQKQ